MARVVSVREVTLKPGVTPADFERYVADELVPAFRRSPAGMAWSMLKGDRGARVGGYLLLAEFDSLEARNRYFPSVEGAGSDEWEQYHEANREVWEKLARLAASFEIYTDYGALDDTAT